MMKNENFNLTNLQTNQAMKKLLLFMAFAVTTLFSVSMHGQACVGPLTVTINGTDTGLPLGLSVSSQQGWDRLYQYDRYIDRSDDRGEYHYSKGYEWLYRRTNGDHPEFPCDKYDG